VIWNSRTREALAAFEAVAAALSLRRIETTISLGGAQIDAEARVAIARPGVVVASFVDQAAELATADVFITHHGLNSTHEAIHHRVPMISYPFIWDQPGMARTCERLGLATPLGDGAMSAVNVDHVLGAIDRIERNGDAMRAALDLAAGWEDAVVRGRPAVLRRMLEIGDDRRRRGIR
jgi:zeaxanthin glucosyltransferase